MNDFENNSTNQEGGQEDFEKMLEIEGDLNPALLKKNGYISFVISENFNVFVSVGKFHYEIKKNYGVDKPFVEGVFNISNRDFLVYDNSGFDSGFFKSGTERWRFREAVRKKIKDYLSQYDI